MIHAIGYKNKKVESMPSLSATAAADSGNNEMEQRMKEYQTFLTSVLRPDLQSAQRDEQETATEIRDYKELKEKLKELRTRGTTAGTSTTTMLVDLGHEKVFCNAEIEISSSGRTIIATKEDSQDNASNAAGPAAAPSMLPFVYVHVGMGFHVQFTIHEALVFADRRIEFLENQVLKKRRVRLDEVKKHVSTSEMILSEIVAKMSR
jgi:prefoldin subunit 5